jgi:hypothetical protein
MIYASALWIHSWLRWAVLITGLVAWFRAIGSGTAKRPWTATDELWGMLFIISLDLQLLVGLALYAFLSPFTAAAFLNFGEAMGNTTLRFWAVEHIFGMVVAIALAHVGRAKARRATPDARRHRLTLIFVGLALVIIIISIPWPGMPVSRGLVRF